MLIRFLFWFSVCTSGLLAGCEQDRIARLEKQNQELAEEVKKSHAVEDYDLQAKCSRDAKTWFREKWSSDKSTILLTYSNHYNRTQNKCFIEIEHHYTIIKDVWNNSIDVWDVYENVEYGSLAVNHRIFPKEQFHEEESVIECDFSGKKCASLEEFNALAKPYMSN